MRKIVAVVSIEKGNPGEGVFAGLICFPFRMLLAAKKECSYSSWQTPQGENTGGTPRACASCKLMALPSSGPGPHRNSTANGEPARRLQSLKELGQRHVGEKPTWPPESWGINGQSVRANSDAEG